MRTLVARMPTPRAFITGVGGQDGALLAALLLDEGYEVAGVVRREPDAYTESLARLAFRDRLVALISSTTRRSSRRCRRRGRPRSTTSLRRRSCRARGTSRC